MAAPAAMRTKIIMPAGAGTQLCTDGAHITFADTDYTNCFPGTYKSGLPDSQDVVANIVPCGQPVPLTADLLIVKEDVDSPLAVMFSRIPSCSFPLLCPMDLAQEAGREHQQFGGLVEIEHEQIHFGQGLHDDSN